MADDKIALALAGVREIVTTARAVFSKSDSRPVDQTFTAGLLLGTTLKLARTVDALALAHRPAQLYGSADDCPHPRPEIHPGATGDELEAWDEWDEAHPDGSPAVKGGDDPGRYCEERPLSMACPGCTEIVQQATGDDTGDPVPADECMVRPLITRHLTGEASRG
jgi:hypothetical protein